MFFWIFMLAVDMLTPVVMIGFGKLFLGAAPKEINAVFGYRTAMSMKNRDTWEFAHKYCGRLWYRLGSILLPLSMIPMLFVIGKDINTVSITGCVIAFVQLIPLLGSIIPTELALKRTFDENGIRR